MDFIIVWRLSMYRHWAKPAAFLRKVHRSYHKKDKNSRRILLPSASLTKFRPENNWKIPKKWQPLFSTFPVRICQNSAYNTVWLLNADGFGYQRCLFFKKCDFFFQISKQIYSKSLSWTWNSNFLPITVINKFKFQARDSYLEYFFFWRFEKRFALSE